MIGWTQEELEILKENYGVITVEELSKLLPKRTTASIAGKAAKLGLQVKRSVPFNQWTDEEIEILKTYYPEEGMIGIQKRLPNHPTVSIYVKAKKLGLVYKYGENKWSEEEVTILKTYYSIEGTGVCFRLNNRSKSTVKAKARSLGVRFDRIQEPWSVEEDEIVCRYYLDNVGTWYLDRDHYDLCLILKEKGFASHNARSIHMKLANYSFLHTGFGLEHASKQSIEVYERMAE